MNLATALSRVDGDTPFLAELATIFIQEYPALLGEAWGSIIHGDQAVLERSAHTLRGRFDFFAMEELRELALKLERMGKEKNWDGARQIIKTIEDRMTDVLPEFERLSRERGT